MYTEQRPLLSNVILLLLLLVSCAIVLFSLSTAHASTSDSSQKKIGISQIVEHSALNIVRQSMIEALKEQGFENGKNLTILYENAHGNLATSIQIATKLTSIPLDVAIAISTPSAQTLLHAAQKQDSHLPIVFTAVTDPKSAKLDPENAHYPITGITDAPDLNGLLELLKKLMPKLKTLGLMYNPSEVNSVNTVTQLKLLLLKEGIATVEVPVNVTNDIPQAIQSLAGKADALYFPQDNTVYAALPTVLNKAAQISPALPVIVPVATEDPALLQNALVAIGYDYRDIGKATGELVVKILNGEDASQIPIQSPPIQKVIINETLVKKLNLTIPSTLNFAEIKLFK